MKQKPKQCHDQTSLLPLFDTAQNQAPSAPKGMKSDDQVRSSQPTPMSEPRKEGPRRPYEDEWWTTAMVCAYLKLGRKAIWERRKNPNLSFPKPVKFGNSHHRWKSEDIKQWTKTPIGEG